jgi:coenzyme F420 hydrogenase subunit beta
MSAGEGKMTITLRDGSQKVIPLTDLADHVKPGCRACGDFTAKLSDISLGSIESAPGMSVAMIRTPEGMGLFKIAEEIGLIEVWPGVRTDAVERVGKIKLGRNGYFRGSPLFSLILMFFIPAGDLYGRSASGVSTPLQEEAAQYTEDI